MSIPGDLRCCQSGRVDTCHLFEQFLKVFHHKGNVGRSLEKKEGGGWLKLLDSQSVFSARLHSEAFRGDYKMQQFPNFFLNHRAPFSFNISFAIGLVLEI